MSLHGPCERNCCIQMDISPLVAEQEDFLRETRRALHRIPEEAFTEKKTSAYLWDALEQMHPDRMEHMVGTGIKTVFFGKDQSTSVGIRADIDALPVAEETGLEFASTHPGYMHACGHDGHMAMALTAARIVSQARDQQEHSYTFIFQPAEETTGGAQPMIEGGVLESPHVTSVYGVHLWPYVPEGKIGLRPGPLMASMIDLNVHIEGKSSHGAKPQDGADAIVAAAHLVAAAQSVVARNVDPFESAVLTIGKMRGGSARNVIADTADIEGTVRTFRESVQERARARMQAICEGIGTTFEVRCEYSESMAYPPVDNSEELYKHAIAVLPEDSWCTPDPVMISEDFSFYQKAVPGLFAFLGTRSPGHEESLHSSRFTFDEAVLALGVEYFLRVTGFRA